MKKIILSSTIIVSFASLGGTAYACDMHGAGFGGYGLRNSSWETFDPRASKKDPSLTNKDLKSPMPAPAAKPKPNFSNAANIAAMKAKARLAKKKDDDTPKQIIKVKSAS